MISKEQIEYNKQKLLEIVDTIDRPGIRELRHMLLSTDFFYAPASSIYHASYEGGLCEHCLETYFELKRLIDNHREYQYEEDTLKVVGLFHDISKINLYKKDIRNKKVYHDNGTKSDNLGRFDWISEEIYKVDKDNKLVYGNHEQTSEFLLRLYVPLTQEESVAVLHHHGGLGWDSVKIDISEIYNKYPLAMFLHIADMLSTYTVSTYE